MDGLSNPGQGEYERQPFDFARGVIDQSNSLLEKTLKDLSLPEWQTEPVVTLAAIKFTPRQIRLDAPIIYPFFHVLTDEQARAVLHALRQAGDAVDKNKLLADIEDHLLSSGRQSPEQN